MKHAVAPLLITVTLAGCSLMPDHSLDYRQAKDLPPLGMPEGQALPPVVRPLYKVPDVKPSERTVALTEKDGRRERFAVPAPEPLPPSVASASARLPDSAAAQPAAKPRLITDGNGYPLMQADGNSDQIWDALERALSAGKLGVEDRNQSLGVYYLKPLAVSGPALQLKLTKTSGGALLSLQLNEDTVADPAIARQLFDKLLENWPG